MSTDNKEINVDRDWGLDINVSGLQAPTGARTLPSGYYKVEVSDMYKNPEGKNPDRIVIKLTLQGEYAGVVRTTGLNPPRDAEDNVRYYWRALAESVGFTPAQLDAGQVHLTPNSFVSKVAHIRFTKKDPENGQQYEDIEFLSEAVWTQRQQASALDNDAQPTTSNSVGKPKAEVMKQLGLA